MVCVEAEKLFGAADFLEIIEFKFKGEAAEFIDINEFKRKLTGNWISKDEAARRNIQQNSTTQGEYAGMDSSKKRKKKSKQQKVQRTKKNEEEKELEILSEEDESEVEEVTKEVEVGRIK